MLGRYGVCPRDVTDIIHQLRWCPAGGGERPTKGRVQSKIRLLISYAVLHLTSLRKTHSSFQGNFCGVHLTKLVIFLATNGYPPSQGASLHLQVRHMGGCWRKLGLAPKFASGPEKLTNGEGGSGESSGGRRCLLATSLRNPANHGKIPAESPENLRKLL